MSLVELDESEVLALRNSKAVLDRLGSNSKTRQRLLSLVKEISPDTAIPEIDAARPVLDVVSKVSERLDAMAKKMDERDADESKTKSAREIESMVEKGRAKLRTAGYQDDGIEAIEKLMQDRGLIDYDAAAALFEKQQPKDNMVQPSDYSKSWDFGTPADGDDTSKNWLKDPVAQSRTEVSKFMREMRAAGGR